MRVAETLDYREGIFPQKIEVGGNYLVYGTENFLPSNSIEEFNLLSLESYKRAGHISKDTSYDEWSNSSLYKPQQILYVYMEHPEYGTFGGLKVFFNNNQHTIEEDLTTDPPTFMLHEEFERIQYGEFQNTKCRDIVEISRLFMTKPKGKVSIEAYAEIGMTLLALTNTLIRSKGKKLVIAVIEKDRALNMVRKTENTEDSSTSIHILETDEPALETIPENFHSYFIDKKGVIMVVEVDKFHKNGKEHNSNIWNTLLIK
jgi:hypothetical protein